MSRQEKSDTDRFELNLSLSRSPRAYSDQENLWADDLKRIYRLISRHYTSLESADSRNERVEKQQSRPHLSIAIFGPSGSGKSSLLRTLARDAGNNKTPPIDLKKKVCSLPVMDPTTWAESDQFLYAFLASALEEERKEMLRRETGYPQGLSPVQLAFQEVNEYLRVIDEPEMSTEYDPLGLSLQKLERHTSGLRLRNALGDFIEQLAEGLVGKESLILLPVDDLDMSPSHLVPSLQSFQSFLTHPRLVPIFTFTDRMPEELIEAHYREVLSERVDSRTLELENRRLAVSEQLSLQFLARTFPVRNRIRLGPAPARVQRAMFHRSGDNNDGRRTGANGPNPEPEKTEVRELLTTASFLLFGHPDREDSHAVRAALRPSTLRRQIQVLDAVADCHVMEFHPEASPSSDPDRRRSETKGYCRHLAGIDGAAQELVDLDRLRDNQKTILKASLAPTVGRLAGLERNATWATIFNGTTWSLLNVHRDTLRELGLHLEDLYSWNPREMRSFVLDKILGQSRITRRVVLDRWFNRTDYRRSQVLSVLAANIFRPWMEGEEPYGDEQMSLGIQLSLEGNPAHGLDRRLAEDKTTSLEDQVDKRLAFSTARGFLWFLDVTIGFYLPQVMARGWSEAIAADEPVKGRMGGNGWDLHNGPVNAIRIADLKQDLFAFGMMFLDAESYKGALAKVREDIADRERWDHLMLRIWTFAGFGRGRFWAAVSLWRGLGLIGQLLEASTRWSEVDHRNLKSVHKDIPKFLGLSIELEQAKRQLAKAKAAVERLQEPKKNSKKTNELVASATVKVEDLQRKVVQLRESDEAAWKTLDGKVRDIKGILKSHLLSGLVPGSLLAKTEDDARVRRAFPKWRPEIDNLDESILALAGELSSWLVEANEAMVYPMPAGDIRIDWGECFIRRVHGEYILGSLWPRLNSAYLESQQQSDNEPWDAQVCLGEWSNLLMEYWRKNKPILKLMMSCPIFLLDARLFREDNWDREKWPKAKDLTQEERKDRRLYEREKRQPEKRKAWGLRLGLLDKHNSSEWDKCDDQWTTVPDIFNLPRAALRDFKVSPPIHHHAVDPKYRIPGYEEQKEQSDPPPSEMKDSEA